MDKDRVETVDDICEAVDELLRTLGLQDTLRLAQQAESIRATLMLNTGKGVLPPACASPDTPLHGWVVALGEAYHELRMLLKEVLPILDHYGPAPPDHQCGGPNAACDGACVDYSRHQELLARMKRAWGLKVERTPAREPGDNQQEG